MPFSIAQIADSTQAGIATAYDSVWSGTDVPTAAPVGLEAVMLQEDKLFVVLAVVLLIWIGLAAFLLRTDRRLARLERSLDEQVEHTDGASARPL